LSTAPARLAGITGQKGALTPGADADFVVWNPEATFEVRPETLHHRHKLTPYAGRTLAGVVEAVFLAGEKISERGRVPGPVRGKILLREKRGDT
jgi:allantoinase